MANRKLTQAPRLELNVNIQLSAVEVRALEALAGYGADAFLRVFYKEMGQHYLKPHEAGLRSLFETIQAELPPIINRLDAAKQAFALHDPIVRDRAEHNATIARAVEAARAPAQQKGPQQ